LILERLNVKRVFINRRTRAVVVVVVMGGGQTEVQATLFSDQDIFTQDIEIKGGKKEGS
jgi:hypothetical protein